jgi:hypothetical protein
MELQLIERSTASKVLMYMCCRVIITVLISKHFVVKSYKSLTLIFKCSNYLVQFINSLGLYTFLLSGWFFLPLFSIVNQLSTVLLHVIISVLIHNGTLQICTITKLYVSKWYVSQWYIKERYLQNGILQNSRVLQNEIWYKTVHY